MILQELERRALRAGYQRLWLTTGFRQPEAVKLYLGHGYLPQFDITRDPEEYSQPPTMADCALAKSLMPTPWRRRADRGERS